MPNGRVFSSFVLACLVYLAVSISVLDGLQLDQAARARLDALAEKANEGRLTPEEAREYDRFIELEDILATLRLKAERQLDSARAR